MLLALARCILHENELLNHFWAKAANTTIFFQNWLPAKALKDKTPLKLGLGMILHYPFLNYLVAFVLHIFHRLSMKNLTRKQLWAFLWAIVQFQKSRKCIILKVERWLSLEMCILLKINNGNRRILKDQYDL